MVGKSVDFFVRAGRGGRADVSRRVPELTPLAKKTVALFGLGCLGAPSAIEFAKAGLRELRILDGDVVDPDTVCRWPLGVSVSGMKKVEALRHFLGDHYSYTKVLTHDRRLGAVQLLPQQGPPDQQVITDMIREASLIYDATAEYGVQNYLSEIAQQSQIPYIGVDATQGGWGGRICRIRKETPGCWSCYQEALTTGTIPRPPADPTGTLQPEGCGDPTFTGASFDLTQIALAGVRMAISTLCEGEEKAYPPMDWDVTTISLRDEKGNLIPPLFQAFKMQPNSTCGRCALSAKPKP